MPSNIFGMVEEKCGIIFASGPAIRQFIAYRRRVGTFSPNKKRQPPEEDFTNFRKRVNLRDVFWYRKPTLVDGRVIRPQRIFHPPTKVKETSEEADRLAQRSMLDHLRVKIGEFFRSLASSQAPSRGIKSPQATQSRFRFKARDKLAEWHLLRSNNSAANARLAMSAERGAGWPGLGSEPAERHVARRLDTLRPTSGGSTSEDFSISKSSSVTPFSSAQKPQQDSSLAELLANPPQRPVYGHENV